jgi:hypothetical protein
MLAFPIIALADTYEIIRGKQYPLCRDMEKNFNEFKNDSPMVCERKFSSKYKDFRRPDWRLLPEEHAVQAAIAIERVRLSRGPVKMFESSVAKETKEIKEAVALGKLKAWEGRFDIARNGERSRVVMVVRGMCEGWTEEWSNPGEPRIGILLEHKFEVDDRYKDLSILDADIFLYQGVPYLASWATFPSAIGREPAPPKRHRAYVHAWDIFWLKHETGTYERGVAGFKGPICQIGYQRIK